MTGNIRYRMARRQLPHRLVPPSHCDLSLNGPAPLYIELWPPFVFIPACPDPRGVRIAFPACPRWRATSFLSHIRMPWAVTPSMPRNGHGKSYCSGLARRHPIRSGESYASGAHIQACGWRKPLRARGLLGYCFVRGSTRCCRSAIRRIPGIDASSAFGQRQRGAEDCRCSLGSGRASTCHPRLLSPSTSNLFRCRVRIPVCEFIRFVRRTWQFSARATRPGGRLGHVARSCRHCPGSQAAQLLQLGALRVAGRRLSGSVLAIARGSAVLSLHRRLWRRCGNCEAGATSPIKRQQFLAQKQLDNNRSARGSQEGKSTAARGRCFPALEGDCGSSPAGNSHRAGTYSVPDPNHARAATSDYRGGA